MPSQNHHKVEREKEPKTIEKQQRLLSIFCECLPISSLQQGPPTKELKHNEWILDIVNKYNDL